MKKVLLLMLVCSLPALVEAGWTVATHPDNTTMPTLLNDGFLFKASNFGNGATAQNIGGISYDIDYSNVSGANPSSHTWASKFYTGTDAGISNLLNTGGKVSEWSPTTMTFTFSGLTIGHDYRFQLLLGGGYGGCDANLYGNNWSDYKYVYFGDGTKPRIATYTWTADAVTRVINTNAGSGHADHYNLAYTVHDTSIPEPITILLFGLGSLIGLRPKK